VEDDFIHGKTTVESNHMRKKTPEEIELDNFLDKKRTADKRWDNIMKNLQNEEKVPFSVISQSINECNWADYALMQK
jgi:hypothetical protein